MATNMSQVAPSKAEKMLKKYEDRLREIRSIDLEAIMFSEICALPQGFEKEIETLDSKKASILSMQTRAYLKNRYLMIIQDYKNIIRIPNLLNVVERMIGNVLAFIDDRLLRDLPPLYREFEVNISIKILPISLKNTFMERYDQHIQKITEIILDDVLPMEFKDSLFYIERTLAEPSIYSLNGLIMWKETADDKIEKIQTRLTHKLPKQIEFVIVKRYESLRKQLKAEILKMRTYPIPQRWCSDCMKNRMTHIIEGEFRFVLCPEIEEDMKPLRTSERDLLPGGITRQKYDTRLNRLHIEYAIARDNLESRNADDIAVKCKQMEDWYTIIEDIVTFTFKELAFLYKDSRSLKYLVNKNEDDKLLKKVYDLVLREIRHFYDNRINIPSFAITIDDNPMAVAPPKEERNIPIASGVDRGGVAGFELDTPAGVIVVKNNLIVADRYGDAVSFYRADDLASIQSHHYPHPADAPVSLTYLQPFVFVCYSSLLAQYSLTWEDNQDCSHMNRVQTISIPQACCTSSNYEHLYVGTLKPSLIRMKLDPLRVEQEYPLSPIRHSKSRNRYPWLQDMKVVFSYAICLFTGSPCPLQMFSLEGKLISSILTEDQIVGAYHFAIFRSPITDEWRIYICDFGDNSIKVFYFSGKLIETVCETGHGLCQIFRPTCLFIERSGFITVCDMKVDNCLQRL